jgi:hypothetical protein
MPTAWRWPPDNDSPRSPDRHVKTARVAVRKLSDPRNYCGKPEWCTDRLQIGAPGAMFSFRVPWNKLRVLRNKAGCPAQFRWINLT